MEFSSVFQSIFSEFFELIVSTTILILVFKNFHRSTAKADYLYILGFTDIFFDILALALQIPLLTYITCVQTLIFLICYAIAMKKLWMTDALTGAYNRGYLSVVKCPHRGTVIYVDIDKFKLINDTYGHASGDVILRDVSEILRSAIGNSGFVVRMGGDEFLGITSISESELCEKIDAKVMKYNKNHNIEISISIGSFSYESNFVSINTLIERADALMYQRKANNT